MAGQLDQIEALVSIAGQLDSPKLDDLYSAIAQRISSSAATSIAEAAGELQSMGIDPDKYIAVPRSYIRNQRELSRMAMEQAKAAQALDHSQELHEQEVRRLNAATVKLEQHVGV